MDIDVLIVGGGVVGLACAAESATRGKATLLIERHESFGHEASSRNSEVIHSGIYYPTGSLKARLCVRANRNLYEECERLDVWYRRCGKLVVAVTPEEVNELERIHARGSANGVEGLQLLSSADAAKMEPNVRCHAALHVPSTGIIDSHELMKAYAHEVKSADGDIVFGMHVLGAEPMTGGYSVCIKDARGEETRVTATTIVNAAGVHAIDVAKSLGIDLAVSGFAMYPNRGHYFRVSGARSREVSRLIYPVPMPHLTGLGIHITLDRAGQMKLGPDAEYIDASVPESEWNQFDPDVSGRKEKFHRAVVRYFPSLTLEDLSPDQVGVRAKLQAPGEPVKDFVIREESAAGFPGIVNLLGIESPGLTCARELAREVFTLLSH